VSRGAVKGSLPAFGAHGNTPACRTVCGRSQENRMVGAHHVSVNGQSAFVRCDLTAKRGPIRTFQPSAALAPSHRGRNCLADPRAFRPAPRMKYRKAFAPATDGGRQHIDIINTLS